MPATCSDRHDCGEHPVSAPTGRRGAARPWAARSIEQRSRGLLRVPEITVYFWIVKGLSTAMGESTSDYLVHRLDPVPAVLLGFVGFAVALSLQLRMRRYMAWTYWFAVVMVGVFGTMCADVLHVGFGIPYAASTCCASSGSRSSSGLWQRTEHTLSIHSIDSDRRELFYWAAVVADVRTRHRARRPDCGQLQPRLLLVDRAVRGAAGRSRPSGTGACTGTRSSRSGSRTS